MDLGSTDVFAFFFVIGDVFVRIFAIFETFFGDGDDFYWGCFDVVFGFSNNSSYSGV